MEGHHAEGDHNKAVETTDRGMFDFLKEDEDDRNGILPRIIIQVVYELFIYFLQSSDEEEEGEDGEKKKKKKGLKGKIKEKISGDKEAREHKDTSIPTANPEEKKGFLDKIKEKLPGQNKKPEDNASDGHPAEREPKEIGILEKIKEKIPGYHGHKTEEDKGKEN
ncbi:Uncharacterized protein TCM_006526 [Theobroma cacao]|uniref:Dehydrin family protein n=1 Tax=Theobroma cacao TaxID=3641 RepID=A0A061DYN6_THECC|nr:Uncharacterized protein TCM_006526 [Theobroma cacao]